MYEERITCVGAGAEMGQSFLFFINALPLRPHSPPFKPHNTRNPSWIPHFYFCFSFLFVMSPLCSTLLCVLMNYNLLGLCLPFFSRRVSPPPLVSPSHAPSYLILPLTPPSLFSLRPYAPLLLISALHYCSARSKSKEKISYFCSVASYRVVSFCL